jgi:hypothetical protein
LVHAYKGLLTNARLNPDVHGYMEEMSDDRRRHLRGAARKVDESHAFSNFRDEYANANNADMARKQAAAEQKKKNADERLRKLQEFEPILNLEGKAIEDDRVERMKTQLRWHREIGGDREIPTGFHSFKKEKLWDTVNQAVKRHQEKCTGHEGKCVTRLHCHNSDETGTYIVPDPAECDRHTVPGTAQGSVNNEDQCNTGFGSPVAEEAAIDDVVLGAPLDENPDMINDAPGHPAGGPVITTDSPQPPKPLCPRIVAGCVWDEDNWSCAYDVVFMSLLSVYRNSSPTWCDKWRQQAPTWNTFLGGAFDSLLSMARNNRTPPAMLSYEFTSFRETFRDKLSQINPAYFRRHGRIPASVCQILSHVFDGSVVCEPYLNQAMACGQCGATTHSRYPFTLLGSTVLLDGYLNEDDTGSIVAAQEI